MTTSSMPPARLMARVHLPDRGSAASPPLNSPTATRRAVSPSEKTNRYRKPRAALRVVLTKVRTAANAGAPHGAATNPEVAPNANTPPTESPLILPTIAATLSGRAMVKTSKSARPHTSSRLPMSRSVQGLELTLPNKVPVRPARRPSREYTRASPTTYASVSAIVRERDRLVPTLPPRIPAVIGIMGYTQGERLV